MLKLFIPLYFVRSGGVDLPFGALRAANVDGYYWSSAAYSAPNAYFLYFYTAIAYPSSNNPRHNGFPIRCVAL